MDDNEEKIINNLQKLPDAELARKLRTWLHTPLAPGLDTLIIEVANRLANSYKSKNNSDLCAEVERLTKENSGVRANSMILNQIIASGRNPVQDDKLVHLMLNNSMLQEQNDSLKKTIAAANDIIEYTATTGKFMCCDVCALNCKENLKCCAKFKWNKYVDTSKSQN